MADSRPAVRIVCVDDSGRLLLMNWRDTFDGRTYWEPPGGGIDPGETPLEAARRELTEETGLDPALIQDVSILVHRNFMWLGTHFEKDEPFYLARFPGEKPHAAPTAFTPEESDTFLGCAWFLPAEMAGLPVDPPTFAEDARRLAGLGGY